MIYINPSKSPLGTVSNTLRGGGAQNGFTCIQPSLEALLLLKLRRVITHYSF